jgi:hypothetical protein
VLGEKGRKTFAATADDATGDFVAVLRQGVYALISGVLRVVALRLLIRRVPMRRSRSKPAGDAIRPSLQVDPAPSSRLREEASRER